MSFSLECCSAYGAVLMTSDDEERQGPLTERRRRTRLPLQLPVYLCRRSETHPMESRTVNLSSEGFYCIVQEPLTPGEHIDCDILFPSHNKEKKDTFLCLRCQALVVRVETISRSARFGLACRIEHYRVIQREGTPAISSQV